VPLSLVNFKSASSGIEDKRGVPHVSIFETWGLSGFPLEAVPPVDEFDFNQWSSSDGLRSLCGDLKVRLRLIASKRKG
jgi:hypothetical protein